uniref:Uncharacterized protein LOC114912958 n=1 Tax=Elaeis guineensis var. tenera TaxID=51953 RepID=A0A8N4IAV6_ELAGV|nr:uncharacterized protein LOC114912958 [Elaeis guineensis]
MRELSVQFGLEAFTKGFELCREKVASRYPDLGLDFLEESDDEAAPSSPAATAVAPPAPGSPPPAPECPAKALPLPLGVPLKSTIQRLKKEVLQLTKKLKKSEGELRQAKKCYSEAAAEAAHFRSLQVKAIMDYSRRKANFTKELEECKKSASDRTWAQEARISALKVELSAAKRRIGQLEGNSSRALVRVDEQKWSQKVSDLQKQLQDAEMSHDVQRASWRRQVEEYKGRFRQAADEIVRLQQQLVTRARLANAQDTEELLALRGTVEGISVSLGEKTAELQQVKIQLGLERKAVADAEAESKVLRKWHREAEAESR